MCSGARVHWLLCNRQEPEGIAAPSASPEPEPEPGRLSSASRRQQDAEQVVEKAAIFIWVNTHTNTHCMLSCFHCVCLFVVLQPSDHSFEQIVMTTVLQQDNSKTSRQIFIKVVKVAVSRLAPVANDGANRKCRRSSG